MSKLQTNRHPDMVNTKPCFQQIKAMQGFHNLTPSAEPAITASGFTIYLLLSLMIPMATMHKTLREFETCIPFSDIINFNFNYFNYKNDLNTKFFTNIL